MANQLPALVASLFALVFCCPIGLTQDQPRIQDKKQTNVARFQGVWEQTHLFFHGATSENRARKCLVFAGDHSYWIYGVYGVNVEQTRVKIAATSKHIDFISLDDDSTVRCLYDFLPDGLAICMNNRGKTLVRPAKIGTTADGVVMQLFKPLVQPADVKDDKSSKDRIALAGLWETVEYEANGARLEMKTDNILNFMKEHRVFYFHGNFCTIFEADGELRAIHEPFQIKGNGDKKAIDLTGPEGLKIPAIYEVKANSLTICWNRHGGERPQDFVTKKGDGQALIRLRRVGVEK